MDGEILFLAHRMPFPPNRGDKIRSHHILKHLATIAPVHVATFAEGADDQAEEAALAALAASHCLVTRSKPLVVAGIQAVLQGAPVSVSAWRDSQIASYVQRVVAERPIRAIYVFSGQMGQYIPAGFGGRVIVDLVDVDSAKFDAYGADHRGIRGLIEAREGRLLRIEEARLAIRAAVCLLVSEPEAELLRDRLGPAQPGAARIAALPNGIDAQSFAPGHVTKAPQIAAAGSPRLIFTGQMDYAPNVAAAERAAERILPIVRRSLPNATLHVVGRNPPDSLRRLERLAGCHVWGEVPDIQQWLGAADIALVPLMLARGIQNKVLEAMAMELPVVLTTAAATGIPAAAGQHFQVADEDMAIAEAIVALALDAAGARAMGQAARRFVVEQMSWPAALQPLEAMLFGEDRVGSRCAA